MSRAPTWWVRLKPVRRVVSAVLAVLGAVMLLVGTWDRFGPKDDSPRAPMTGDINVAVAEFGMGGPDGNVTVTPASAALSESVFEVLSRELDEIEARSSGDLGDSDFEVQDPATTGPVDGETVAERAAQARRIAERAAIDVVIYAVVDESTTGTGTATTPEIFLTDRRLAEGAEELIGHYQLGQPVQQSAAVSASIGARRELRARILTRTHGLLQMVVGLSSYALQDYEHADEVFAAIEDEGLLGPQDGAEILHLFSGNAAGRLGNLDAAEDQYRRALEVNPAYSRAQIGMAETTYQRAHHGCQPGVVDVAGVQQARDLYAAARQAADKPAGSNVDVKAALGTGRIHLCLSLAGAEVAWDEARADLEQVVDVYRAGNTSVAELAAEAWSNLGLLEIQTAAGNEQALERAVDDLQQAIASSTAQSSQSRHYIWFGFLGTAQCQLGRTTDALAAYDMSIDLAPASARPTYESARALAALGCPSLHP